MTPKLQKDLETVAKEVAEKHGTTIIIPEYLIASTIIQFKLEILGSNAKDKAQKIDIKDTCSKLKNEVANLMNIVIKLMPELAIDPLRCQKLQHDVDEALKPIIYFHFLGIGDGRKPS